ncbi:MAG: hypothetical protein ACMXYG_04105 [Candidatus Woesearchaeota archaeon]
MAKKTKGIGGWAFLIGLVLAIIIAIIGADSAPWAITTLAILGIIVGLFNITGKEMVPFMIATLTFIVTFQSLSTVLGKIPGIGGFFENFFQLLIVFVAPAAALVAISALMILTKE